MKKKILLAIVCICMAAAAFLPLSFGSDSSSHAIFASEKDILNQVDIVGVDSSTMTPELARVTDKATPFDSSSRGPMRGSSFTPRTTTDNQVDTQRYGISSFSIDAYSSIYMWIYIPDSPELNYYSLEIGFEGLGTETLKWHFTPMDLVTLLKGAYGYAYGWKFIELSQMDATEKQFTENTSFYYMTVSYKYIKEDNIGDFDAGYTPISNGKLSIYHVYKGDRVDSSGKTVVHTSNRYVNFEFKAEFQNKLNEILLGDVFVVPAISDMFNYIYVGKNNLLTSGVENNAFSWAITISNSLQSYDVISNEKFNHFDTKGIYLFKISLTEDRASRASTGHTLVDIFSTSFDLSIHEYLFGKFSKSHYELSGSNTLMLTFAVDDGYDLTGEIKVTSSKPKVFKVQSFSYDKDSGQVTILVKGKRNGKANIIITSEGLSSRDNAKKTYTVSSVVEVTGVDMWKIGWKNSILFLLGFYVVAMAVFFFFTYRNIKKNRERQKRK